MNLIPSPRLENCELSSGGHNPGYNRMLPHGDDCVVTQISDDGYFLIDFRNQTHRFWNHNPLWCQSLVSRGTNSKIALVNSTINSPTAAHLFISAEGEPWRSWTRIPLSDSPSPCGTYRRLPTVGGPPVAVEADELELDPEDPLSISLFVENIEPTFEFYDDGYSARGWEIDDQWFVSVTGPEGFFQSTFHAGYDESNAREMAQVTIDDNKR